MSVTAPTQLGRAAHGVGVNAVPPVLPEIDPHPCPLGTGWCAAGGVQSHWGAVSASRSGFGSLPFKSSSHNAFPFVGGHLQLPGHRQQTWISRPNMWTLLASSKELWPLTPRAGRAETHSAMGLTSSLGHWRLGAESGILQGGMQEKTAG